MKRLICGAIAAGLLAAGVSSARANLLTNGSLTPTVSPTMPDNLVYITATQNTAALTGWTLDSGAVDVVPNSYWRSSLGANHYSVDLVGSPGIGSISQELTTVIGQTYTLTFDFAANPEKGMGGNNERGDSKVMRIQALDGATVVKQQSYTILRGSRTNAHMEYVRKTFTFVADTTDTTLRLMALAPLNMPRHLTASTVYTGPVISNLKLAAIGSPSGGQVPEPASLGILALGSVGLLRRRKRA